MTRSHDSEIHNTHALPRYTMAGTAHKCARSLMSGGSWEDGAAVRHCPR